MVDSKSLIPYEKDSRQSWIALVVSFSTFVVIGGITIPTFGIMLPYLEYYFKNVGDDYSAVMNIGPLQNGIMLLFAPLGGLIIARFGIHASCIGGCLIASLSIIFSTISPTVMKLNILYGVFSGIGLSMLLIKIIISCDLSFERYRVVASTISRSGQFFGFFVFPSLYSLAIEKYDWKMCFYITSIILLFILMVELLIIAMETAITKRKCYLENRNIDTMNENQNLISSENSAKYVQLSSIIASKENLNISAEKSIEYVNDKENADKPCPREFEESSNTTILKYTWSMIFHHYGFLINRNGVALLILLGKFFGEGTIIVHNTILPSLLLEKGIEEDDSVLIVLIENGVGLLSCILCGLILNHYRKSKTITPVNVTTIAFLIAGLAYLIMYFAENFSLLMTLCVVSGLTKSTYLALNSVLWFDLIPTDAFVLAIAYTQVVQGFGSIMFPLIVSFLYSNYGDYTTGMLVESSAAVICAIFFASGSYVSQINGNT